MEEYRDIQGYEGLYQVSNYGNVKSLFQKGYRRDKVLKPIENGHGYLFVRLHKNNTTKHLYIHRLVAETFIQNPEEKPTVNHLDHNTKNNNVSNLSWATFAEQVDKICIDKKIKAQTNGKCSKMVRCVNTGVVYPSLAEVNRQLNYDASSIAKVCRGVNKSAYGFKWEFV